MDMKRKRASSDNEEDLEGFITITKTIEELEILNSKQHNAYQKLDKTVKNLRRLNGGKEKSNKKIVELEKMLNISRDENFALKIRIEELEKYQEEKEADFNDLESLNQNMMVRERKYNYENQEARQELIKSMKGLQGGVTIGIKRLGELDPAPFAAAVKKRKCSGSGPPRATSEPDSSVEARKVCSLWEKHLRDPGWHPYRMVNVGEKYQEIIDDEDPKLKGLRADLGEEAYKAVTTSLLEMNEYNPSGRYPVSEIWNFLEGRKASLKEGYGFVFEKLKNVGKSSVVSSSSIAIAVANSSSSAPRPNTAMTNPSSSAPRLNTATTNPSSSAPRPSIVATNPSSSTPSSSAPRPNTATPNPSSSAPHPNIAVTNPSSSTPNPSSSTPNPSSSAPRPNTAMTNPSSSAPRLNTATTNPSSSAPRPNTAATNPSSSTPNPSSSAPRPNTATPNPTSSAPRPNIAATNPSSSTPSYLDPCEIPAEEFHDFMADKSYGKFRCGQIWALYCYLDDLPRYYVRITRVITNPDFKVHLRYLDSYFSPNHKIRWADKNMPICCGSFNVGGETEVYKNVHPFSHMVSAKLVSKNVYEIYPRRGEVWAIYKDFRTKWTCSDLKNCKYDIVEVVEDNVSKINVLVLEQVTGFNKVFKPKKNSTGVDFIREITEAKLLMTFSHQIPAFRLTEENEGRLRGYWELYRNSMPDHLFASN